MNSTFCLSYLNRYGITGMGDAITLIDINQLGFKRGQFFLIKANIGRDDNYIIRIGFMRCCTIDRNNAGIVFRTDRVGSEAFTISDVVDFNLLVFTNS